MVLKDYTIDREAGTITLSIKELESFRDHFHEIFKENYEKVDFKKETPSRPYHDMIYYNGRADSLRYILKLTEPLEAL